MGWLDVGPRPWETEPDREEWASPNGYSCLILRVDWSGALCGYVTLPEGHPWRVLEALAVPADVHGGCTWNAVLEGEFRCGFDCSHAFDFCPAVHSRLPVAILAGLSYRTIGYVRDQTAGLARQAYLAAVGVATIHAQRKARA